MKLRYASIMDNDVVDGLDVCVSLWVQGCPHHCFNCHNPETWDFNTGTEIDVKEISDILINKIGENGIRRNFSVLGGEPLCNENIDQVCQIIENIRDAYEDILIFVWTGSTYEKLLEEDYLNTFKRILRCIDVLIDGPYIDSKRDLTLFLRGSSNQRVINIDKMREANNFNDIILF